MKILSDGSVEGQTFSGDKYKGEYPRPKNGETYAKYRERVQKCKENGFNLGDLGSSDYQTYCMGSGNYGSFDSDTIIR